MSKRMLIALVAILWLLPARGEEPTTEPTSQEATTQPEHRDKKKSATTKETAEPVTTEHEITLGETTFKYKSTAGFIPLKDAKDKPTAKVFFIAYDRKLDDESARKDR